jgi:4-amino-4-deoxy-L-arabinose transferase-like glycosyltransferase
MKRKAVERDRVLQAAWIFLAVIFLGLVIAIRIRLLGIPLERDEGEYAYAGQLTLQGIPPYKLAYNMKFPGTYAAYALIMAMFGQTIVGIHLGLLLVNAATISLIFLLGRRLINSIAGIAAAMTYAVLSISPSVFGFAAHATHFVMLPVLGGTLLLVRSVPPGALWDRRTAPTQQAGKTALAKGRHSSASEGTPRQSARTALLQLFASGLLFGIGLLMKQPAIFFVLFGAIYLLANRKRFRDRPHRFKIHVPILIFGIGTLLPFAITCLILWHAGVFDKFWFWTINYARQYGSLIPLADAPKMFAKTFAPVIESSWLLWMLAGLGLVAGLWNERTQALFLLGLFVSSFLALSAGFYFREHYFIFILPAVSLFAGVAGSALCKLAVRHGSLVRFSLFLLFCVMLSQPILAARKLYFEGSLVEASHKCYGINPFPESVRLAEYLRDHTEGGDTIAVLGSEPQIYFYSKRHSATGYIYAYGLMEPQSYARQMQEEMIRQIESARPKYLIMIGVPSSWGRRASSETLIFTWANDYMRKFYDVVGLVNIVSHDHTDYYFDQLPEPTPQLASYILICRRKS